MWFGAKSMFDKAGFKEVARRKPQRPFIVRLLEAGPVEHGFGPEPHVVVLGASRFVHGVGLDQRGALFLGVGDCPLEERLCNALSTVHGRHHKADD